MCCLGILGTLCCRCPKDALYRQCRRKRKNRRKRCVLNHADIDNQFTMSRLSRLSFSDNEDAWRHNSKKGLTTALIFFSGVSPSLQEEYAQSEKSYIKEKPIYPALHCCSELNIDNSKQSFRSNHDYQQQKRSIRFLQQCRILVFNLRSAKIMSSRVMLNFHALL